LVIPRGVLPSTLERKKPAGGGGTGRLIPKGGGAAAGGGVRGRRRDPPSPFEDDSLLRVLVPRINLHNSFVLLKGG